MQLLDAVSAAHLGGQAMQKLYERMRFPVDEEFSKALKNHHRKGNAQTTIETIVKRTRLYTQGLQCAKTGIIKSASGYLLSFNQRHDKTSYSLDLRIAESGNAILASASLECVYDRILISATDMKGYFWVGEKLLGLNQENYTPFSAHRYCRPILATEVLQCMDEFQEGVQIIWRSAEIVHQAAALYHIGAETRGYAHNIKDVSPQTSAKLLHKAELNQQEAEWLISHIQIREMPTLKKYL